VRLSEAAEAWDRTNNASIPVLEAFVARYGNTFYSELARSRIEQLKKQSIAVASQSSGPAALPSVAAAGPFDGMWHLTINSGPGCLTKTWSSFITIEGSKIQSGAKFPGKLAPNGAFQFYIPKASTGQIGAFQGNLQGDAGTGTFQYGARCNGRISLKRL
jgi:hypothetical protein